MAGKRIGWREARGWLGEIVGPDTPYLRLAMVYGVAISLLSLATPISVQLLINSVANTALPAPLWTLAGLLLVLLLFVAGLSAMRFWVMALFERRFFARVVAEITERAVHAQNPFFADQNRGDLFNRYFDLVVVQKAVPSLVIGAFTIILQSAVGLVVTSFYHPFFLAFNALLILLVLAIWTIWSRGSIRSAVALSHAKHEAARWLESLGGSNGFYKSSRHLDFAMDRSEAVTATYVDRHERYFRYSFAQTVAFLLLYAFASAALLALGGNLILRGELSIGQLVAAELILSGVFYGVSQLGWYLDTLYDLIASAEELSLLFAIPQEQAAATAGQAPGDGAVRLEAVEVEGARFDFSLAAGEQLVTLADGGAERLLAMVLKRHIVPERGLVTVGGADMATFDMYLLRSAVVVLDRPTIVEVTIREYLSLAAAAGSDPGGMLEVLDAVGLRERVAQFPHGLDTPLAASGYPLAIGEVVALKLASALLVRPRVLMLSQLCDLIPAERLADVLRRLKAAGTTTLLCTGRPEDIVLDGWFRLEPHRQRRFATHAALITDAHTESNDAV
ncbi:MULTISPECIES: ABC transporter transmembrane domain-containing protein [Sphingomonas]|uniref:ABC transporter transmembrane domain-containing protein n=1 Tax=Sphingomonas TaxID=13687 RepID=UPI0006F51A1D|nr:MULTISPECIES: ABC transporter transmembrane domain-containing protein [Sphingomonas]KQM91357.1 ABC transporter ATP-binding protein [Sphingomonas sp. Leaf226]MDY0966356.1 ABC transporter ATP-binding protein [Sphingomonas sp. CFBP9021]USR00018.1 ABC transporter ATP-binding protein [Sphingomonas aerolata]